MPSSSSLSPGILQGLHSAIKEPLTAALSRAAAAEGEAAAVDKAVATVTAENEALALQNQLLVQLLAEANAARAEAEQRLRVARLEPAAARGSGAAAQQREGALEQVGVQFCALVQLHLACMLSAELLCAALPALVRSRQTCTSYRC